MDQNYQILDRRFILPETNASEGDVAVAKLCVNMEIVVHMPLCVATYVGIVTGALWSHELEVLTLAIQLVGMIFFVGPDFMTECMNMVPHDKPGCIPGFSFFEFFYFWFGVSVNFVWFFVPITMLVSAIRRSVSLKTKKQD